MSVTWLEEVNIVFLSDFLIGESPRNGVMEYFGIVTAIGTMCRHTIYNQPQWTLGGSE